MLRNRFNTIFVCFCLYFFPITDLLPQEFIVDKSAENIVKFLSEATIEDFEGTTSDIDGYLFLPENGDLDSSEIYFEVDLRTLDTGIGLRNRHMRDNYLETDKYPYATFKGNIASQNIEDSTVVVNGILEIHGVKRNMTVNGSLEPTENGFAIGTKFSIKLTDFNIEIPSFMFLKISNKIELVLNFAVKE